MAIYSLNLRSIGRSTHASGTAGAHLHYIAREGAEPELAAEYMPTDPTEARTWMDNAERADRKNARVIDKVRIAIPRELSPQQRMELVRDFAKGITKDRVPWLAAIHASGKDAHNPHCHLVIRDRDIDTGKRVLRLSDSPRDRAKAGLEPKAVEYVRAQWEHYANQALERAGHDVRIDRRSLEAQGIDREPTIHIGPQAAHVDAHVERPRSKKRETGNGRMIDYPEIDQGRTRKERHAEVVDFNLEKAARSPDFRTRETAKFEQEQRAKDRLLEDRLIREARARTLEEREAKAALRDELGREREILRDEARAMTTALRRERTEQRQGLAERHRTERDGLARQQRRLGASFLRMVDITGRTRARQVADKEALGSRHKAERDAMVQAHRERWEAHQETLRSRARIIRVEIRVKHRERLGPMKERHADAERLDDEERQKRVAKRELAERRFESAIAQSERIMTTRDAELERGRMKGPRIR
ncbi:MAG: MobA/MobL family protein [Pseudomonadota bacterium]